MIVIKRINGSFPETGVTKIVPINRNNITRPNVGDVHILSATVRWLVTSCRQRPAWRRSPLRDVLCGLQPTWWMLLYRSSNRLSSGLQGEPTRFWFTRLYFIQTIYVDLWFSKISNSHARDAMHLRSAAHGDLVELRSRITRLHNTEKVG